MDPKANIAEQLELARDIQETSEDLEFYAGDADVAIAGMAQRLAELVIELDEWRSRGGFDPYASGRPWRGSR